MNDDQKVELRKKARLRMLKYRQAHSSKKKSEIRAHNRERRRLARLCKKIGNPNSSEENGIDIHQSNFDCFMSSLMWKTCTKCKKRVMKSCYDKESCKDCYLFTESNNMDPGDLPDELKDLTYVEQQLIARVHPVISVYKIKKGEQLKYSGQVINFPQNVQEVCNVLPPTVNSLSNILTVRVSNCEGFKDFNVRRSKVRNALVWLKNNNPHYEDVEISDANIDLLPLNGDVYLQCRGYDCNDDSSCTPDDIEGVHYLSYSELGDEELEGIDLKDVPNLTGISQRDKVGHCLDNTVLLWPSIGITPINEFGSPGYIGMAFPHLFPFAKADFSSRESTDISLSKYIQHLMLYHDQRFSKDPRFRFFMMNSQMRWQSLNVGNVFVKKNNFFSDFTVLQLKKYLETHPEMLSHIMFYSSRLRSTKSYWKSRCSELLDMVNDLGSPTVFFTLSSADYHWKDLYRLLGVEDLSRLSYGEKTKLISENPLIVSKFFKLRCETFLHKCFFNKFNVIDYWYRVEFQHRGSSHVHGVVWLENAPDIKNVSTEAEKQNIVDYFDKIISCENPDISFKPNLVHPCEKSVSDCTNLEEDLAELVNRVQRHTKCSASYCLRTTKDSKTPVCRFGFPKPLCEMSEILVKENGIELQYACNDVLLNKYNPWVLQTWRSNIDFTAIVSDEILSRYIAKYAAKCEVKSNAYDDLLKNILSNNQSDDENCKKIIRKLLISTCAERDYSAQEVMFILMGFPLYHSSRQFVILNLKDSVWESILSCQSENNRKVFIQHYIDRPQYLEQISLLECAKCYYVKSGKWILRKKSAVVRVFPRNILSVDSELECLKNCCILNIPWKSIGELNVPEDILKNKLDSISYNWYDTDECDFLLEWSDSECDSQSENVDEDDDNDWKIISRLNSRKQTKEISTGENRNFNWDYAIDKYDLTEIHTICETIESEKVEEYVEIIDYTLLSEDQKRAFQHFCSLVNDCVKGEEWSKERLIFVQGRAGYGKSFLLKAMKSYCFQKLGLDSYAVVAYSGVAAKNVNGITIHSFLKIPPKQQYFRDLNGDELHKFQEKNRNLRILFIDEYSMVGLRLLGMMDQRCRQAKDNDEILGNLCVVMLGDIHQLGPIFDNPLYTQQLNVGSNSFSQRGKLVLMSFEICFFLCTAMRFDNHDYIQFLDRVSCGMCTKADVKMLRKRSILNLKEVERLQFKNCLRICAKKDASHECNTSNLKNLRSPIARIAAENNSKKAFSCTDDMANGLSNVLYLALNSRIMLRKNLNVSMGFVNGALGTIKDIIYAKGCRPPQLPLFVIVQFDDHDGFEALDGNVPIRASQADWYVSRSHCTRAQFPLSLSWACTIHKSQSLTLAKTELDLGAEEFQLGLTYVGLSRVKNAESLILLSLVTLKRLNYIRYSKQFKLRENFLLWLQTLVKDL